jgi:hypothetical protein
MGRGRRLRKSGGGELEVNKQDFDASNEAILPNFDMSDEVIFLAYVVGGDLEVVKPHVATSDAAIAQQNVAASDARIVQQNVATSDAGIAQQNVAA